MTSAAPTGNRMSTRLLQLAQPLTLMAFRTANTAAKFLLTIYTARYLGLADLGVYGLLAGAATILPAMLGFGTVDWVVRHIAVMAREEAIASIATRLVLPVLVHAVVQPAIWAANYALGAPVPWPLLLIGGAVLFLDHMAADTNELLIGRGHIMLANILFFMRAGLWPPVVIAWGILDPSARTLQCLLLGWLGALVLVWIVLVAHLFSKARWRSFALRWSWMTGGVRSSVPFYIKDLTGSASLYLDRFFLSLFLGLELTGVYTLFWSIANVLHNLTAFSVIQPQLRSLIKTASETDEAPLRALERKLQIEGAAWIAVLAVATSIALLLILPLLDRPLLRENLFIFWIILAATALRAGADSYGFLMLALHKDKEIAMISLGGVIASVVLNLVLVPTFGLAGAAVAYLLTGGGMLAVRYAVTRPTRTTSQRPRLKSTPVVRRETNSKKRRGGNKK